MLNEWLSSVGLRLRALWKRRQLDKELKEEIEFHLAMREQKLRASGAGEAEARHAARRGFGNVTRLGEDTRMLWTFRWLENLAQDLRYAARSLRKSPVLAVVVVLSIALGIGANTAIFTLMDAVSLRMLPVERPEQLLLLETQSPRASRTFPIVTNAIWEAVREQQDVFSGVFAWSSFPVDNRFDLSRGGATEYIGGVYVSGSYFPTLGLRPAAGRLLTAADDHRGCPAVAVLSYGFWQSHFGGAESALGTTISLNGEPFQIVGVSPAGFHGMDVGQRFDAAVPICSVELFDQRLPRYSAPGKRSRLDIDSWWLNVMGRLKPGMTAERAKARLAVLSPSIVGAALPEDYSPAEQKDFLETTLVGVPAATGTSSLRGNFAEPLAILMGIVTLVLLIACANIASLMLARGTARGREIAVRKALGASRGRLLGQLLTEAMLLSTAGALAGLLFARWGSALLARGLSTGQQPVFLDLSLDGRIGGFTAALAVLTGVLVGLLPALRSTRVSVMGAMKGSPASGGGPGGPFRAGKWIVGLQVALSLVLLIGGGLLLRSFTNLATLDMGFDRTGVLLVNAKLDAAKAPPEQWAAVYADIEARLRALPGVQSESRSLVSPMSGRAIGNAFHPDVENPPKGPALVWLNFVTPGYLETLRTPLVTGRALDTRDTATSPRVAVIDEAVARKFFPGVDPVGRQFGIGLGGKPVKGIEVVGVAKDAKYKSPREEMHATVYLPLTQLPGTDRGDIIELRTSLRPTSLVPLVERAVAAVNPHISLEFSTLEQQVDDSMVQERLLARLSGFFGGLALLLAMVGLYGVISYLIALRHREFAVRMALGAQRRSILRLVIVDVMSVLTGGVLAGLLIAMGSVNLLRKMLFGLEPRDTFTIALSVCVLYATSLLAGYLPARRATRVDPMAALRYE
jgi:putative ABC transport system permease protein